VSLNELARLCRCHPELVERFARFGLIDPVDKTTSGTFLFPRSSVPRLRRAFRLRQDLGLNTYSLTLVLDLLDRIEELELEVKRLKH
jgi:DNA-binding transcriptional MerR regulator